MNNINTKMIHAIMVLAFALGIFMPSQVNAAEASAPVLTFVAEADAMVKEASPASTYGNAAIQYVKGGAEVDIESYFRFTVTGISGSVVSAKMRVYVAEGVNNGPAVYATSNDWQETGLTWSNRPARTSDARDDKGALPSNSWVEYDVTPAITGNGTFSFILATDSPERLGVSSRQGTAAPELVVTVSETTAADPAATLVQPTNTVIAPTASPVSTLVQPTNTVIPPAATATSTPKLPAPTATLPPVLAPSQSSGNSGMWITSSELMYLPTSGTAWDKMRSYAYGSWGTANLQNQDNKHDVYMLAGAFVYGRTGDPALRIKVRDAILAAKRSLDQSTEWQSQNGVLAAGRQIGAYVIAADMIGLRTFDPAADGEFRTWLSAIRTTNIGTHGRWKNIKFTCENAAANWGTFACASRIAASIYLGDTVDVARSALIIRAFLGERSVYPADATGKNGYFERTGGYNATWACNDAAWTGINPGCIKLGVNIDGVLVDDASRGGGCCTLQGSGISYSWEALQGLYVSAELLYRTGAYGDPYQWSNKALKRSLDFMQRSGWGISNVSKYVPWLANKRYGTAYPVGPSITGRIMGWGDWLYQR